MLSAFGMCLLSEHAVDSHSHLNAATCPAGVYQEGMMGEGSQGGTLPIYSGGSTQSGWSDASCSVNGAPTMGALPKNDYHNAYMSAIHQGTC
jgi:hypothetical protein